MTCRRMQTSQINRHPSFVDNPISKAVRRNEVEDEDIVEGDPMDEAEAEVEDVVIIALNMKEGGVIIMKDEEEASIPEVSVNCP